MKDVKKVKTLKSGGNVTKKLQNTKAVTKLTSDNVISGLENPLFDKVSKLKKKIPLWDSFFSDEAADSREEYWAILDDVGQKLCEKYAWAVPDERALNIVKNFSPLIEIGSGKGYWAKLLQNRGVDIVGFDKFTGGKSKTNFTKIKEGGPEKLLEDIAQNRNLFLCYPDEAESIAIVCLENFTGEYIIHVGELMCNTTGTMAGAPVAPYGRTTSAEFQITLPEQFHCLLVCNLSNRYPYSKDCISVWKRTQYVAGKYFSGDEEGSGSEEEGSDEDEDEESAPTLVSAQDTEVEYMDMNMLARLRGELPPSKAAPVAGKNKKNATAPPVVEPAAKKSKKNTPSEEAVEFIDIKTLNALRAGTTNSAKTAIQESKKTNGNKEKSSKGSGLAAHSVDKKDSSAAKLAQLRAKAEQEGSDEDEEAEDDENDDDSHGSEEQEDYESYSGSDGGSDMGSDDPYAGLTDLQRSREMALDDQYNEDKDNGWCNIPADEILPTDRAAPCLAHLLK